MRSGSLSGKRPARKPTWQTWSTTKKMRSKRPHSLSFTSLVSLLWLICSKSAGRICWKTWVSWRRESAITRTVTLEWTTVKRLHCECLWTKHLQRWPESNWTKSEGLKMLLRIHRKSEVRRLEFMAENCPNFPKREKVKPGGNFSRKGSRILWCSPRLCLSRIKSFGPRMI